MTEQKQLGFLGVNRGKQGNKHRRITNESKGHLKEITECMHGISMQHRYPQPTEKGEIMLFYMDMRKNTTTHPIFLIDGLKEVIRDVHGIAWILQTATVSARNEVDIDHDMLDILADMAFSAHQALESYYPMVEELWDNQHKKTDNPNLSEVEAKPQVNKPL